MTTIHHHATRVLATLVAGLLLALGLAGPALAQDDATCVSEPDPTEESEYPPGRDSVTVGATVVTPGAVIEIAGDDWSCDTDVEIVVVDNSDANNARAEQVVGRATTDDQGTFTTEVVVPEDVTADQVTIEVRGVDRAGETRADQVQIDVQPASQGIDGIELQSAGTNVPWVLVVLSLVLLAGAGALIVRGRQNA